jgi:hypothetical protein
LQANAKELLLQIKSKTNSVLQKRLEVGAWFPKIIKA